MTAWKMWIADERKFQEANLAEIRKYPVTEPQRLTDQHAWVRCRAPISIRKTM